MNNIDPSGGGAETLLVNGVELTVVGNATVIGSIAKVGTSKVANLLNILPSATSAIAGAALSGFSTPSKETYYNPNPSESTGTSAALKTAERGVFMQAAKEYDESVTNLKGQSFINASPAYVSQYEAGVADARRKAINKKAVETMGWGYSYNSETGDIDHSLAAEQAGENFNRFADKVALPLVEGASYLSGLGEIKAVWRARRLFSLTRSSLAVEKLSVASSAGGNTLPMSVEKILPQGSKIDDIINDVKGMTWTTGNEHAVVRLANGQKAIVSGGPGGIKFQQNQIKTLFGHTHPTSAPPSAADFSSLKILKQSKQYVIHGGQTTLIRP